MSRFRLRTTLLLAALVGGSLATGSSPVSAHSSDEVGHDPHKYVNPHAGYVAPPRAPGRLAPATGALLGTHSDDSHSGALTMEEQGILRTEATSGRVMDIDNSYYGSFTSIAEDWDPTKQKPFSWDDETTWEKRGLSKLAYWDVKMGRIPLVGWGCGKSTSIASGSLDSVIRETAVAMKALPADFMMRYCWEMDGSKRTSEVGNPEDFVKAWIRIWTIFAEEGATNVVHVWTGNANGFKNKNSKGAYAWEYYPGDEYVDWVAADGYNWGASDRNTGLSKDRWRGMVEIYDEFMVWARSTGPIPQSVIEEEELTITEFPRKKAVKPIQIGEYGAIEPSGSIRDDLTAVAPYVNKADWLRESHQAVNGNLPRTAECDWCGIYSDIAAMVYFDIVGPNGPWIINSSEESKAAWRESAAQQPWFNQIHTVGWAPASNRPDAPPPGVDPPVQNPPVGNPPVQNPPTGGGNDPVTRPQGGTTAGTGYWMLGADGIIYPFGEAKGYGNAATTQGAADIEPTPSGLGYWIVDSSGSVFASGDATYFGRIEAAKLAAGEKVTSLSATPTGKGYWIFTSLGRVATFGDASAFGDLTATKLNGPVLDSIPTPSGKGYYMVGSDGGIFAFGDATFHGSLGDMKLNAPVQSLVPTADGRGYWLVASDGGIFAFGNAPFRGSLGSTKLNKPITGMVPFGNGYLMVGEDGGIFNFSDKDFLGSLGANPPARPVVSVAVR